jgi:ADP-heptose:LPS heptosyltransferase
MKRVNAEYFNLWKEMAFLGLLNVVKTCRTAEKNNRVLLVNPCLIGEFAASLPAIADYIRRNKNKKIDLVVTSPLKTLAEKVRGVERVFVTQSVYERKNELQPCAEQDFGAYEKIVVMRAGRKAHAALRRVKSCEFQTAFPNLMKYSFHLSKSLTLGRRPRKWKAVNFEILGGTDRKMPLNEIFSFAPSDYASLDRFDCLAGPQEKIIIHTGTNWEMKHWARENWIELLRKLRGNGNFRFIFVGNREDEEDYQYISPRLGFPTDSLINRTNLVELTLALRRADYFIGIDSGPRNLAHMADLRSVTILGPGPHMYISDDSDDIVIDKTGDRGAYQMFFSVKDSYINRISVEEVHESFMRLYLKGRLRRRTETPAPDYYTAQASFGSALGAAAM